MARENVAVGAGSGEFLKAAIPAFVDPQRALVAPRPTFETCMEAAAQGAGLVYFSNPNNPTGTIVPTRDVEGMLDRMATRSPETVMLLDEAYADFVLSKDYTTLSSRAARDRNLLVLRTFSKAHSRITLGTAAEMERATAVFKAVLG